MALLTAQACTQSVPSLTKTTVDHQSWQELVNILTDYDEGEIGYSFDVAFHSEESVHELVFLEEQWAQQENIVAWSHAWYSRGKSANTILLESRESADFFTDGGGIPALATWFEDQLTVVDGGVELWFTSTNNNLDALQEILAKLAGAHLITQAPSVLESACDTESIRDWGGLNVPLRSMWRTYGRTKPCGDISKYAALLHARSSVPLSYPGVFDSGIYARITASGVSHTFPSTYLNMQLGVSKSDHEDPGYPNGLYSVDHYTSGYLNYWGDYSVEKIFPVGQVRYTGFTAKNVELEISPGIPGSPPQMSLTLSAETRFAPRTESAEETRNGYVLGGICEGPLQYETLRHLHARTSPEVPSYESHQLANQPLFEQKVASLTPNRPPQQLQYGTVTITDATNGRTFNGVSVEFYGLPGHYVYVPEYNTGFCVRPGT